jgi:hypothetical protein
MLGMDLLNIFDPAELSPWPGIEKETTDEARDALFKYFRPEHVKEHLGEFDLSSISPDAKKLLTRCMSRIEVSLVAIRKRSKKFATNDKVKVSFVQMIIYQLAVDQSFRASGLTLNIPYMDLSDEEKKTYVRDVANAIIAIPDVIKDIKSKLKGAD